MNTVRDENGKWLNSDAFRCEAIKFQQSGMYCPDPIGSPAWIEYWEEQRERIIYGYEIEGVQITGEHYFYLNFCPISRVEDPNSKKSRKVLDFPDFWDGDYDYFWARKIARFGVLEAVLGLENIELINRIEALEDEDHRNSRIKNIFDSLKVGFNISSTYYGGGYNLCVGKSRRRGYSLKNASCAARNYITNPSTLWIFGAYDTKFLYPRGIMTMCLNYINFLNSHTAFVMPTDEINRNNHIKASYIEYENGVRKVGGFKSEVMSITYKDNADAARGKDAVEIDFEESGAFGTPGLLQKSYRATEDCVKAGVVKTGMIVVFGTSGDLDGGTADYKDMFMNPGKYGMMGFEVDYEGSKINVGFFHAANKNLEGFYDKQGNSDIAGATAAIMKERADMLAHGGTSLDLQQMMQEKPLSFAEAFTAAGTNTFPVLELTKQYNYVKLNNLNILRGQVVSLYRDPETKKILAEADLSGRLTPITSVEGAVADKRGAVVIYEPYIESAPYNSYCIGYDPVNQDDGTSLACVVVFKKSVQGSGRSNIIVAEWIGRNETNDDNHRVVEMLAEMYNSKIMFENMGQDTRTYFRRIRKQHLLALQPDNVISKSIKKSTVTRVFGCHITKELKADGEVYIKDWLLEKIDYDENGDAVLSIDTIYSLRLLDELINYKSVSNKFDMVSALTMCMFQREENILNTEEYKVKTNDKLKKLQNLFKKHY